MSWDYWLQTWKVETRKARLRACVRCAVCGGIVAAVVFAAIFGS